MEKLVRDRVPRLMMEQGLRPRFRTATADEMRGLLLAKLEEEAAEVNASLSVEELADIYEVVLALASVLGVRPAELERARQRKAQLAGAFDERLVLVSEAS